MAVAPSSTKAILISVPPLSQWEWFGTGLHPQIQSGRCSLFFKIRREAIYGSFSF